MSDNQPAIQPTRSSRGRRSLILLPLVLIASYFIGRSVVRIHVDAVIHGREGEPLPDFELEDRDGRRWSRERLLGRPTVVHFFRSYCPSCDAEADDFRRFEESEPKGRTNIVHVMTDEVLGFAPDATAAAIARKRFQRPILMADEAFVDAFHTVSWSNVTPVTYIVDAEGQIRVALRGKQTLDALREALDEVR
jgi:peroxiredoxin